MVTTRRRARDPPSDPPPPSKQAKTAASSSKTAKPAASSASSSSTKQPKQPSTPAPDPSTPRYFLMKAEPLPRLERGHDVSFSIHDLAARAAPEPWDGVRNAEAAATMRTAMRPGDLAFFYHSNCPNPGIAGVMRIATPGYPDASAVDPAHPYFDPKSNAAKPKWWRVDVEYVRTMRRLVGLRELKAFKEGALRDMQLLRRPQLSVQKVSPEEWEFVLAREKEGEEGSGF